MRDAESLPFSFRTVEHVWIPMADGTRLSARLWLPETSDPVPAVVEYIPYRKRDDTRWRDEPMHGYFAGHGYAAVRVDVRGSGASEGVLEDEYSDAELEDGVSVLRWVGSQPWCTGRVGLMGKSWGGINALQIAARRPPELAAVITVCSSDDRYRTDAHYMGGLLLTENLTWGTVLTTLAARHPDPEVVGEAWRSMWMDRLGALRPFPAVWLRHQLRDAYWERGSVARDYNSVQCPVMAVGGWADAYTDTVPRLLAGLATPRRGLVGPWAHLYPHNGAPGPAVGFLQEALRWWDRWLRDGAGPGAVAGSGRVDPHTKLGPDSGSDPMYRVWMAEPGRAPGTYGEEAGRWVGEDSWPSPRIRTEHRPLLAVEGPASGQSQAPSAGSDATVPSSLVGLNAGAWCPFGLAGDLPGLQNDDDAAALCFDFPPQEERMEILGAPAVDLTVTADGPEGALAVRICDVAPDGTSRRVAYGLLNLGRRDGFDRHEPLVPGRTERIRVELGHTAWAFLPGHRIRVAISEGYWPVAWPLASPATLRIDPGASTLELPVRPPQPEDEELRPMPPPEWVTTTQDDDPTDDSFQRTVVRDPHSGEVRVSQHLGVDAQGSVAVAPVADLDLHTGFAIEEEFSIVPGVPTSARGRIRHTVVTCRGAWRTRLDVCMEMRCDAHHFTVEGWVAAWENEVEAYRRSWNERIPRTGA